MDFTRNTLILIWTKGKLKIKRLIFETLSRGKILTALKKKKSIRILLSNIKFQIINTSAVHRGQVLRQPGRRLLPSVTHVPL